MRIGQWTVILGFVGLGIGMIIANFTTFDLLELIRGIANFGLGVIFGTSLAVICSIIGLVIDNQND